MDSSRRSLLSGGAAGLVAGAGVAAAAAVSAAPAHATSAAEHAAGGSRAASGAPGRSGQVPGPPPTRYDRASKRANPASDVGCPLGKGD
ncbi:hypothetical protein GCM10027060_10140 [Nesterenkonia halophila]|uniref:hypothetical protein n=1 Tax=Nesterenkonia halophila TaxID=302044 RepID=UPI00129098D8|nr:hypothetical protein [Nesterenkonia halophila]